MVHRLPTNLNTTTPTRQTTSGYHQEKDNEHNTFDWEDASSFLDGQDLSSISCYDDDHYDESFYDDEDDDSDEPYGQQQLLKADGDGGDLHVKNLLYDVEDDSNLYEDDDGGCGNIWTEETVASGNAISNHSSPQSRTPVSADTLAEKMADLDNLWSKTTSTTTSPSRSPPRIMPQDTHKSNRNSIIVASFKKTTPPGEEAVISPPAFPAHTTFFSQQTPLTPTRRNSEQIVEKQTIPITTIYEDSALSDDDDEKYSVFFDNDEDEYETKRVILELHRLDLPGNNNDKRPYNKKSSQRYRGTKLNANSNYYLKVILVVVAGIIIATNTTAPSSWSIHQKVSTAFIGAFEGLLSSTSETILRIQKSKPEEQQQPKPQKKKWLTNAWKKIRRKLQRRPR